MNIKYCDLFYTVIKNRKKKQNVIDKINGNDYINFKVFISPNHYSG